MPQSLGVAVIGLGYWGPNLLRNFASADGYRLVLACDKDSGRLAKACAQYPIRGVASSAEALRDPEVDLVAVATPLGTHYSLVKAALLAGKHVWVEKPLADRVEHAEELVDIARRKGLVLMVDHTYLYHPAVETIHSFIKAGKLGQIWYYDSVRINLGLFHNDADVLWDLAPHDLSIMEFLVNKPIRWVQAMGACLAGQKQASLAYLAVQFEGETVGHLHVNWLSPVKVRQVIIGGSKRMVVYDDLVPAEKVKFYDRGVDITSATAIREAMVAYRLGDIHSPALAQDEALRKAVAHMARCIKDGRKPLTDGEAGLRIVRTIAAAEKSLKDGRRVKLS